MPPRRFEDSAATTARPTCWPDGFLGFYEDRYQPLVRVAALILRRRDVAEEVVQEVMVQMAARWDAIDHPVTYARTAVVHRSRTALRRHRREQPTEKTDVEVAVADDVFPPQFTAMWQAVGTLSPRRRAAVVLRFYEDLTDNEIATILDSTEAATDPRPRRRRTVALTAAAVMLTATAAGAASQLWDFDVEVFSEPDGDQVGVIYNSDLFAAGAPLHCTGIFDMPPSQAAALARDRGFEVSWQYDVPGWPIDKKPPEDAYIDAVVMMDETTARLIATPERRPIRPDRGCPQ